MNILLYFTSQINPLCGGTERVADNLARGFQRFGHKISLLSKYQVKGTYDFPCYFLPEKETLSPSNLEYIKTLCNHLSIDIIINEAGGTDDVYLFNKSIVRGGVKF